MVWAGIMLDGCTDHHLFDGDPVNCVKYRVKILEMYVHLFRCAVGTDFNLMDENTLPHRTNFWKMLTFAGWIGQPDL